MSNTVDLSQPMIGCKLTAQQASLQSFQFNPPNDYASDGAIMEVKCTVDFGGIQEKLEQLGPKLARKALRRAVSKAGDLWVSEMKAKVPTDTGDLRDSINKKVTTSKKGNDISAKVSVGPTYDTKSRNAGDSSQQPGTYGLFVELGTKSMRPVPFMRPVFDANVEKVVQIVADTLKEDLESTVKSR